MFCIYTKLNFTYPFENETMDLTHLNDGVSSTLGWRLLCKRGLRVYILPIPANDKESSLPIEIAPLYT